MTGKHYDSRQRQCPKCHAKTIMRESHTETTRVTSTHGNNAHEIEIVENMPASCVCMACGKEWGES